MDTSFASAVFVTGASVTLKNFQRPNLGESVGFVALHC